MNKLRYRAGLLASVCVPVLVAACGGASAPARGPNTAAHKTEAPTDTRPHAEREAPPPSGPARDYHFPAVAWAELPTGLHVATIENKALPLVQIRVVVAAGKAADAEKTGLAMLTAQLLKDGGAGALSSRDLLTRIESLGGTLSINTSFDATVLSIGVTKDHMAEALTLLGTIVSAPQMAQNEFTKLKKREIDRVSDSARTSGRWSASMVLWRDLFTLPTDHHPYASFDATPAEIGKLSLADCRNFAKKFYTAKNTFVVVAGDTTAADVKTAAEKAFASYRGEGAPVVSFTNPMPPEATKITLVDRPKSSQSDIYVGSLGPERNDKAWAPFAVTNQILGGGVSGRLFLDVREKQSLAYDTRSSIHELAHGPALLVAYAGTQTAKTGVAMKALLDQLDKLGTSAPSGDEVENATRFLSDVFGVKLETTGALADELVRLHLLGLPDDYDDGYRKQLRQVIPAAAGATASEYVRTGHVIVVVAGDANVIGPMLSHFGEVKVVDPLKNFERVRTIPMNAQAPLEIARQAGQ